MKPPNIINNTKMLFYLILVSTFTFPLPEANSHIYSQDNYDEYKNKDETSRKCIEKGKNKNVPMCKG